MPKKENKYNLKRFYEMLDIAKGERSLRQYALDAGVSPTHLYRLRKEEYLPSAKMINALTSEDAAPRGNITTADLMIAIGYQDEDIKIIPSYAINIENDKDREKRREFEKRVLEYSTAVEGIILKELLAKDIDISSMNLEDKIGDNRFLLRPDIALSIKNQGIKEWFFEIKYFKRNDVKNVDQIAKLIMGELTFIEPQKDRKITIVLNDEDLYNFFVDLKNAISYQGELSAILIDENSLSIVEETYLSHFNYKDESLELKID